MLTLGAHCAMQQILILIFKFENVPITLEISDMLDFWTPQRRNPRTKINLTLIGYCLYFYSECDKERCKQSAV